MSFGKSRGLVRTGDRLDTARVYEFVKANQARYPIATTQHLRSGQVCAGCWVSPPAGTMRGASGLARSALEGMPSWPIGSAGSTFTREAPMGRGASTLSWPMRACAWGENGWLA